MATKDELRPFLARLLGWASGEMIDVALRSIDLASNHRAHLVLQDAGDLVPIAQSLHRRILGADRPFVICEIHRIVDEYAADAIAELHARDACFHRWRPSMDHRAPDIAR